MLRDASGNGNDGKIMGAAWVKGKKGAALDFDGRGDYVECGDTLSTRLRGPLTVSAWVMPSVPEGSGIQYVVSRGDWNLSIRNDGLPVLEVKPGDASQPSIWLKLDSFPAKAPLRPNEWTFLAGVYDTERKCVEIFVNGQLSNSMPKTDGFVGGIFRNKLTLGQERYQHCFNGLMSDVRIYSKALSAEELNRLYESTQPDPDLAPPECRLRVKPHLFFASREIVAEVSLT